MNNMFQLKLSLCSCPFCQFGFGFSSVSWEIPLCGGQVVAPLSVFLSAGTMTCKGEISCIVRLPCRSHAFFILVSPPISVFRMRKIEMTSMQRKGRGRGKKQVLTQTLPQVGRRAENGTFQE